MAKLIDLTGRRFGRWTVIEKDPESHRCRTMHPYIGKPTLTTFAKWRCRCDCGTEKSVIGINLTTGKSRSCGCWQKEQVSQRNIARQQPHGSDGKFIPIDRRAENDGRGVFVSSDRT